MLTAKAGGLAAPWQEKEHAMTRRAAGNPGRLLPPEAGEQLALGFDQREFDIAEIHQATGLYTTAPEIRALLNRLGWPAKGERLLDPGAGNGGFLVAALSRLNLAVDDVAEAVRRVRGYEFYSAAVAEARQAVRDHLIGRGWSVQAAWQAALAIVEERDYLLSPVPDETFDVIATNPPYLRYANLPAGYRAEFGEIVPGYARPDLLYAYLDLSARVIAPDGRIGVITADRWLINDGAAALRRRLGEVYSITDVHRLDPASAFYRAKTRRSGTPPRVHPVSLILTPGTAGRTLDARPFRIEPLPDVDGTPLAAIAEIRIAPYLGPDGIFIVTDTTGLPEDHLVPIVEPRDIKGEQIREARKWALVTRADELPPPAILAHLDKALKNMPESRSRNPRWLPPEPFPGLPLKQDAVLVPRIATHLRAIRLPAGRLPVNHQLVIISGRPVEDIIAMLNDPLVQAQADAVAPRIDNGFRSYTTTRLRDLIIPRHHLTPAAHDAA
jgi:hypothetical protein